MKEKQTLNILLADDDEDDRMLFTDIVEQLEKNIILNTVDDGEQLINVLIDGDGELPDIIFLDLNMPNKNGKECLREIKAHERLKHLPVIIYSTSAAERDVREAYNNGATLYIQKPSNIKGLKKTLSEVLSMNWKEERPQFGKDSFLLKAMLAFRRFVLTRGAEKHHGAASPRDGDLFRNWCLAVNLRQQVHKAHNIISLFADSPPQACRTSHNKGGRQAFMV